jgi:hypothetical protein
LVIPARQVTRRTILAAPCRSSRRPSAAVNNGPSVRSPMARSMARGARGERYGHHLAALTRDDQGAVPALQAQVLDVRPGRLRHPQPVQRQQRDQRVLGGRPEPGGDQQRAELVAVQGGGVRLVIQPGTTDVRCGRVLEELFLD